jgi:uncharacterized protein
MPDERDVVPAASAFERLRLLTASKTIAMVGLSPDPMRPSHFAAIYMLAEGYDVVPVNPRAAGTTILGQLVYASLSEIPRPVDIVDVFRKPEDCPPVAEEAVKIGAKALWLQLGIKSPESEAIARAGGLEFVQDRCVKIEHARFFGGLNLVGMNTGVITARRRLV